MINLDLKGYELMKAGSDVISRDRYGDKVLRLADGTMAKLFRRKRLLSSALIYPYAKRFEKAARKLIEMNIPCVDVIGSYRIKDIRRDLVIYRPLEGKTLRDFLRDSRTLSPVLHKFSEFFASLHNKGIYFRAIHFGNVIVLPRGGFGLIDVSEFHLCRAPLSLSKRVRNFKPIFRYKEDREAVESFGFERFIDCYLSKSNLESSARERFLRWYNKAVCQDSNGSLL